MLRVMKEDLMMENANVGASISIISLSSFNCGLRNDVLEAFGLKFTHI